MVATKLIFSGVFFFSSFSILILFFFHCYLLLGFIEVDEDEPLNLSIKSNRSNSNAIIWSPASICEKESEGLPIKVELGQIKSESLHSNSHTVANSSSSSSSASSVSSMRTPQPLPIQELFEKAHANGISADFLQKLQRRTNDNANGTFPSSLTQAAAAAAAAAAAVQAATNTTEFLSHLHKQEFDLIAKNHLDLYTENLLNTNENLRNNNEKLRIANLHNYNNNNNDTTLNDANKLSNTHIKHSIKTEGPKNTRSIESNRMQKLFQVSEQATKHFQFYNFNS